MKKINFKYSPLPGFIAKGFTHIWHTRRFLSLSALTLLFALTTGAASNTEYIPPHSHPGPATDTTNFSAYAVEIAPKEIEAGSMDMYIFSLKTAAAQKLQDNPDIQVYQAPASMVSIILNFK